MTITRLSSDHWLDYKKLRLESLANSPESFLSTMEETNKEKTTEWKSKIKNMFFAMNDDGQLIGMIGCYKEPYTKLQHIANIVSFYIKPEFRSQGLGKEMLMTAINFAKTELNVVKIQLKVTTTQKTAYALYKSIGFIVIGEHKMAIKIDNDFYNEYSMELYL